MRHKRLHPLWTLLLFPLLAGFGGPLVEQTREGNQALQSGNPEEALQHYAEAQLADPENASLFYNIGAAQLAQGKYDEALEQFMRARNADDPTVRARAHYGRGNALVKLAETETEQEPAIARLEQAIEAYTAALELDPDDQDAKANIEIVRRMVELKKQEPPEQQQQQGQQNQEGEEGEQQEGEQQQQQAGGEQQEGEQQEGEQQAQQTEAGEEQEGEQQQAQKGEQGEQGEEEQQKENAQAGEEQGEQQEGQPMGEGEELTREEAERILDSLGRDEGEELKRRLGQRPASRSMEKDW